MSSHQSISRTLGAWLSFATTGFLSACLGACSAAGDVSPEDTATSEDAISGDRQMVEGIALECRTVTQ